MQRYDVTITTNGSGAGTGYTDGPVNGVIHAIRYVKTDYASLDLTVTGAVSGIGVLTVTGVGSSTTWQPRGATCDTLGTASLYAAAGQPVNDGVPVCDEPVQLVVANGGDTKTGTFYIYVGT